MQAPLLFSLRLQETFSQWYLQEGLGRYWGILLAGPLSLAALAAHLKPYLIVQDEQGQRNLMRFYDPRVIRAYLNALTRTQGEALFKPDLHLWGDAPGHAGALMHFHLGAGHYRQEKILIHQDNKREACSC